MKTILIVEDDPEIRENLDQILYYEGFKVLKAKNGIEGYKIALESLPDLIISDIKMPEMDGIQLAQKLQDNERTFSIPFIFLTAKIEIENIREGMNIGADDYITKPFKINDILNSINARLKKLDLRQNFISDFSKFMTKKIPYEFRTPLVGILGMSDMILFNYKDLSDREIIEMIEDIRNSGKELHTKVEKFIKYAELFDDEIYNKNNYLNNSRYQINSNKISRLLNYNAQKFNRSQDLIVNFESANVKILGKFYETAVIELLENSIKYSPKNKNINVNGIKSGNNYITQIVDEGIDFTNFEANKIGFITKYNINNNFSEGFGLGLFLIKNIIELFQGKLKFYRTEDTFNIVEFAIPLNEI